MHGLLTWPAYGSWFPRLQRGWIDRQRRGDLDPLPEPTRRADDRRERLKWPPITLSPPQQAVVIGDLVRVAGLRDFDLRAAVAAPDHVHVLLDCAPDRDVPRLVQLIKGALSRALTVAAGDEPARSTGGGALVHHKWWTRQYSFRWIADPAAVGRVLEALRAHGAAGASLWTDPHWTGGAPDDIGE
jgi:REP element-mobilizing transposase RayT